MIDQRRKLFMIETTVRYHMDPDPTWKEKIGRHLWCKGCGSINDLYPRPMDEIVQLRLRASVTGSESHATAMKRSFYELLRPHVQGMVTGEVRFKDGRLQKDAVVVTFPPSLQIVMRGGHGSVAKGGYRVCEICGRRVGCYAFYTRPYNVVRCELPTGDVMCYHDAIVLSDRLASTLDLSPYPDLYLEPILILDEPLEPVPAFGEGPTTEQGA
jgi:hypothetical protein